MQKEEEKIYNPILFSTPVNRQHTLLMLKCRPNPDYL